jgi:hypothetical protein
MHNVATVSSRWTRQTRSATYGTLYKQPLIKRFRYVIEETDWDKRFFCNHRIDQVCIGVIIASVFYFIPLLIHVFIR